MDGDTSWLGRRLAVAGAAVLAAGAIACAAPACADESAAASGDGAQQVEQPAGQGTQIADMSSVTVSSADSDSVRPADVPEGENPRPGMDSVGAPEKRPGAEEGEELAPAVKVAPECDADQDSVTLWVWAASMNVDPEIAIRQLNAWRTQAAQNGVTDAQGEAIQGEALTWSDSLAYAAQELAVEIALGGGDTSTLERLNGSGSITAGAGNTFFKKTNIVGVSVTTSLTSVQGALDAWYVESDAYWAGPASTVYHTAGDYANAVSNKARAVGMAAVMLSNEEVYIVCVYGDAVPEEVGDTTYELTTGSAIYQGVNVRRDYLNLVLDVPETCTAGQEVVLGLRASTSLSGNAVSKDMGVAIDSQAILEGATVQVVQDGQVVGEVRDGVLQAKDGFASGGATVEVVVEGAVLASAQTELVAVPESVQDGSAFDVSVPSGGAVELPATAQVVWSGGAVSDEAVVWDALTDEQAGIVAGREGGTFEVSGTVEATGETVTSTVTVEPATMVSAETPTADFVWAGGTPTLPETLAVSWSNGDVTDEAVTWQLPDTSQAGTVQAVGAVEGLEQQVVVDVEVRAAEVESVDASGLGDVQVASGSGSSDLVASLPQSVPVTWSDGSVSDEPIAWDALTAEQEGVLASREGGQFEVSGTVGQTGQTVSALVSVSPASAVSAEAPAAQEIWVGGTPDLPQTVAVIWSNGEVTDEAVEWAVSEGAFSQAGTVALQGSVACLPDAPVELSVTVRALEVASVDASQVGQVDVASGVAGADALSSLPQSVPVTWSDGSVSDEPITWDTLTAEQEGVLASREGGTVEVQGGVGTTGQTVSASIAVAPAYATSVETPAQVEVWQGGQAELPAEVSVTWSNGDVTQQAVTWDSVDTSEPGSYEVAGSVEGCDAQISATVEVKAPEASEVNGAAAVEASVEAGVSPEEALSALPQTVPVTWSNGDVTDEPVAWDSLTEAQQATVASREGGTVEVQGSVGATGQTVTATVEVQPAQATSVEDPAQVEVWQGSDPDLPAEVSVTWSNGDVTQQAVTWDDVDTSEPGTYEVSGGVEDCDVQAAATVEVKALEVSEVNGSTGVEASVVSGASPEEALSALPQTVPVTWSDGSVSEEPVTWDSLTEAQEITVSSREGGTVEVQGSVGATGQTVTAAIEVQPAQVVQIEELQPVTVEVGEVPKLPGQVVVTWSNGYVTVEPVVWDAVDTSQAGSREVKGELTGVDATVTAKVEVKSDEQAVTTPASGDSTGSATTTPESQTAATPSTGADTSSSTADASSPQLAEASEEASTREASGLPAWLMATIAGIGAALVAAGAFIVGKKYNAADEDPVGKHAAK